MISYSKQPIQKKIRFVITLLTALLAIACYRNEDDELPVDTDSQGGDTDSDSGSEDTDSDTSPILPCPVNSGYPCACDQTSTICEDGSTCAVVSDTSVYGFCTVPCEGPDDSHSCVETLGYGVFGYCGATMDQAPEPNYCIIVCAFGEDSGPCPEQLTCTSQDGANADICLPAQ